MELAVRVAGVWSAVNELGPCNVTFGLWDFSVGWMHLPSTRHAQN